MKMSLNTEQAAWYVERDGAKLVHADADGSLTYRGELISGGAYTFTVHAAAVDEFNTRRDRVYSVLAAKRRAAKR